MDIQVKQIRDDLFAVEVCLNDGSVNVACTVSTMSEAFTYARGLADGYTYARQALGSPILHSVAKLIA